MAGDGCDDGGLGTRAFRLVVLALTLAGFVVLHGFVAAGENGAHCGPHDTAILGLQAACHPSAPATAGEAGHASRSTAWSSFSAERVRGGHLGPRAPVL